MLRHAPIWWRPAGAAAAQRDLGRHYRGRADRRLLAQQRRDRPVDRDDGPDASRQTRGGSAGFLERGKRMVGGYYRRMRPTRLAEESSASRSASTTSPDACERQRAAARASKTSWSSTATRCARGAFRRARPPVSWACPTTTPAERLCRGLRPDGRRRRRPGGPVAGRASRTRLAGASPGDALMGKRSDGVFERMPQDAYATPAAGVQPLLPYLGSGNPFHRALCRRGRAGRASEARRPCAGERLRPAARCADETLSKSQRRRDLHNESAVGSLGPARNHRQPLKPSTDLALARRGLDAHPTINSLHAAAAGDRQRRAPEVDCGIPAHGQRQRGVDSVDRPDDRANIRFIGRGGATGSSRAKAGEV